MFVEILVYIPGRPQLSTMLIIFLTLLYQFPCVLEGKGQGITHYFERLGDELDPIQDFVHNGDTEGFVH